MTASRRSPWWYLAVGVLAALPSLLWAADGSDLIHDDWNIAESFEHNGVWHEIVSRSTGSPGRPLTALYLGVTYGLFGTSPMPHVLVLAALNAAAAVLVLLVADRFLRADNAAWVALAWAALPNRGSTRMWIATGSAMLAVVLLLVSVLLLAADRKVAGSLVAAASVLAYEAVVGVAVGAVAFLAWRARPRSPGRWAAAAVPAAAAAGFIFLVSPKRNPEANRPFANVGRLVSAQLGVGPFGMLARVGGVILLIAIAVAIARLLPSFRRVLGTRDRCVLAGLATLVLGASPFAAAGYPFTTDGLVDRGNLTAGLGTALVLGAVLWWSASKGVVGLAVAATALGFVGSLNAVDLRAYRAAVRDGHVMLDRVAADVPRFEEPLLVGPPLPNRNGVTQFIVDYDLTGALRLARDDFSLEARMALTAREVDVGPEPLRYDWRARRLMRR